MPTEKTQRAVSVRPIDEPATGSDVQPSGAAAPSRVSGIEVRRQTLVFSPFRLEVNDERLFRDQVAVPLKPKALQVLLRLLKSHGNLVTKRELLRDVWSGVAVGESVLKVCISEIRAALDDSADSPRFIQTVHARGYRFIAAVEELSALRFEPRLFIGREREKEALLVALERVASGVGEMMLISGEPGIGKTALLEAFLGHVEATRSLWVAHGRCTGHAGQREPYMPLLEAFGRLGRGPGAHVFLPALARCAPTWAVQLQSLLGPEDLARAHELATGATQGRMLREMGDFIEELAHERPFVLSIDDLHSSDRATLDLLEYLAKRRSNMRLLMLATTRPWENVAALEQADDASLLTPATASAWEELRLAPLSFSELEEFVKKRFHDPEWATAAAERLHHRTGGNPLFLHGVINHQVRTGSFHREAGGWSFRENPATWQVPSELRGFILHWFAERSPSERRLLQVASVIGLEFESQLLAGALNLPAEEVRIQCELQTARGFLNRVADFDFSAPLARPASELFRFSHPLIQQVLHDSLRAEDRVTYHLQVARKLEPSRVYPARLAHHFEQGGAYPEAVEHHIKAGESAHKRYAYHDAVYHFERARTLLTRVPGPSEPLELRILLLLGQPLVNIYGWTAPTVESVYLRAYELCRDVRGAAHFASLSGLYKFFLARGQFETAGEIAERCHGCAVELGYRPLVMTGHAMRGFASYFLGDLELARRELEASRALYHRAECQSFAQIFGDDPGVGCLGFLARVEFLASRLDVARELSRGAVTLARDIAHPHVIATSLALAAHVEAWANNDAAVCELADELANISRNQNFALWAVIARFFSAWVRCRAGYHCALAEVCGAFAVYDGIGALADRATYATLLAELLVRLDRRDACRELVEAALATPPRMPVWDQRLRRVLERC